MLGAQGNQATLEPDEYFRAFADATPVLLWICGPDRQGVYFNRAWLTFTGASADQFLGECWLEFIHPDDRQPASDAFSRACRQREAFTTEFRLLRSDGEYRWFLDNASARFAADGTFLGFVRTCIDITEQKQAVDALRQSDERFARFMRHLPGLAWIKDLQGRYIYANDAAEIAFQVSRAELYGKTDDEVFPPEVAAAFRANDREALAGESGVQIIETLEHADGIVHHSLVSKFRIPSVEEHAALVGGIAIDITERKLAEQALSAKEKELQLVAETTPLILTRCGCDLKYRFVNRAAASLFAASPEALIGKPIEESLGESAFAQIKPYIDDVLRGTPVEFETEIDFPAVRRRWIRATYMPERDEGGQVAGWIASIVDITELKHAEDALRDAHRRKDEFLAMLAHELRNPLAPIRSGLDLLALGADRERETVALMQDQVQHLVRLVDDLLDVSRVMRGKIELRVQTVDLLEVVLRAVSAVRPFIESRRQQLVFSLPQRSYWLRADPVRLAQVLQNLLHNAAKYTDAEGRIELHVSDERGYAAIGVRDTGIGIEPELAASIFDLFTQSSRSLDRSQGGLGIGLTLARRLVDMHGGSISVHSDGPGKGSEFIVRLPLWEIAPPVAETVQPATSAPRRRVVVVDDNLPAAKMLKALLAKLGEHEVSLVHDGAAALDVISTQRPDLVLLDIGLPHMDGYAVARGIRGNPDLDDVFLVAVTGYGHDDDRRRSKEAGFDLHLTKPIGIADLESLLHHKLPR